MIIYDLQCSQGHLFEGWFESIAAFEEQNASKMITCPVCGDDSIEVKPAVVNVIGQDTSEHSKQMLPMSPRMIHDFISKHFEDVGASFAEVAMKIHKGEEEQRNIKGITTVQEEEMLCEEGVAFVKMRLPKFDS